MEIILGFTILLICGLLAYEKHQNKKVVEKLTNALIAKSAQELTQMDMADRVAVVQPVETKPDLIPEDELSDKEFDERVLGGNYG